MSQSGETDGFSVEDHVEAIHKHLGKNVITHVLVNTLEIPQEILEKYEGEHAHVIQMNSTDHEYKVIAKDFLDLSAGNVRHNAEAISKEIQNIANEVN